MTEKLVKILIVEDEKFMSSILKSRLEEVGFVVQSAINGREAWDKIDIFEPNLILLDLIMPEMDGFEFMDKLNKTQSLRNIKVIVASNLAQEEDKKKAMELGALDYIVKAELDIDVLIEKIQKVLG